MQSGAVKALTRAARCTSQECIAQFNTIETLCHGGFSQELFDLVFFKYIKYSFTSEVFCFFFFFFETNETSALLCSRSCR